MHLDRQQLVRAETRAQHARIIYDFDGTLTPQPMQEYTVLPKLGIGGSEFWKEVDVEVKKTGGESEHRNRHTSDAAEQEFLSQFIPGRFVW